MNVCYSVFLLVQVYENVFKCGSWCFLLRACLVTPKTRVWTVGALVAYLPNKDCFREASETNNRVVRALLSPLVCIIRAGCSIDDLYIFITCWQCINGKIWGGGDVSNERLQILPICCLLKSILNLNLNCYSLV